jgi:polysaccharide deacetylase family protein (PEP-CTERM system associated)
MLTNCLSIDVEGFIESNLESCPSFAEYLDKDRERYEIEKNTQAALTVLSESAVSATFFFVGRIAREIPHLVREVAGAGHEIACHSYEHLRCVGIPRDEFKQQLRSAKNRLEDVSGKQVCGFRAPEFSITQASLWVLDVLKEIGFAYDSSIYPIAMHDVYGMKDAKPVVHILRNGLIEWPLASIEFLGVRFPFGGGGYFRLYPLSLTELCISSVNRQQQPCMFYIHPYELGPIVPRVTNISPYRRFRHYFHCAAGQSRLQCLLQAFSFGPAAEILTSMGLLQVASTA